MEVSYVGPNPEIVILVEFIASKVVRVSNWFAKLFIYLRKPV